MTILLTLFLAVTPAADQVMGKPLGTPHRGTALEKRTEEVASLLRCPVCQGLSVADSPATMALNMKSQVREMLSWGYSQEQIISYFEKSYGQFVRLDPPRKGINWLVWLGPLIALVIGAVIITATIRRGAGRGTHSSLRSSGQAGAAGETPAHLDPYVARVRELTGREHGG